MVGKIAYWHRNHAQDAEQRLEKPSAHNLGRELRRRPNFLFGFGVTL
jgi:hypothetical protein